MDEGYSKAEVLFVTATMDVLQASEREKTQTLKEKRKPQRLLEASLLYHIRICVL